MYWYNPTTRASERVAAPSTDEEAIQVLAGDLDSATFVSEYAEQRHLGMEIETALTMVGHQVRLRRHEYPPVRQPSHDRPGRSRPVLAGTSSFWQCAFEKKVGIEKECIAPRQGVMQDFV